MSTKDGRSGRTAGLPRVGVTMGDAAGIGPEVVLKSLADREVFEACRPVIIGDLRALERSSLQFDLDLKLERYDRGSAAEPGVVPVVDLDNLPASYETGRDHAVTGKASAEYIDAAVDLWRRGDIDAVATAPISKRAIAMGGYDFPGHTEFLAQRTGVEKFAMSFFAGRLRVVLLSIHIPLRDAIELVRRDRLIELIRFSHEHLSKLLSRDVTIAVAGLNPHASEGGMFGAEESAEIVPAIEYCLDAHGINVSGPFSPDTVFLRGFRGEFDAVLACYHDQATIAVKSLSFGSSVNVTLGLPIIRTSVDHGTAFDIAGRGAADASSMTAAIRLAAELSEISRRREGVS